MPYQDPEWTPVSMMNLKAVIRTQDAKNESKYLQIADAPGGSADVEFATREQIDEYLFPSD